MSMSKILLPEYDHEMAVTRRVLERVPEDQLDFKPHPKSMSMRRLANHIAEIAYWGFTVLDDESFDVAPPDGPAYVSPDLGTRQEILEHFDTNVAKTRALLEKLPDEALRPTWSLLRNGQPVIAMPRGTVWRGFIVSHTIHHRAQLGVYLRMSGQPVPSMYGPSADEQGM
jgi:uncharacterized damage-inducible protein DinB